MKTEFEVEASGGRLDAFLADQVADQSRNKLQSMIRNGQVQVNGTVVTKPAFGLAKGDRIHVSLHDRDPALYTSEPPELDIIYEGNDYLVLNKPPGIVVHPSHGHESGTLAQGVMAYAPELKGLGETGREGLVHRLDKDTSGLILFAKNEKSLGLFQRQFKAREVKKTYLALVDGTPPSSKGRIEASIGRDPRNRQRFAILEREGRPAITEFKVREQFKRHTLLEAQPITGRTHQIRIHLKFLGCTVVGDRVYGRKKSTLEVKRQMLHAWKLKLPDGEEFEAPVPDDFAEAINLARSG